MAAGGDGLGHDVVAGDGGGAGGGGDEARKHAHGGGLAGAVGAEEAEDLALVEAEGDIVHRGEAAEPLGQARDLDQCRHASPPRPPVPAVGSSRIDGHCKRGGRRGAGEWQRVNRAAT